MVTLEDVVAARRRIGGSLHRTPLLRSTSLGNNLGIELWLKAEVFQKTGSFKPRGTLNRLRGARPRELELGFVTASAGNLAQGLAWAAHEVGCPAVVVMPESTPKGKIDASRGYGAEVIVDGPMSQLLEHTEEVRHARGLTMIHPWDDPLVVSGYGTLALEVLEDLDQVSLMVVPVGGGGLISGLASVVKASSPRTRVVGVEPEGAPGMQRSLEAGRPARLAEVSTIAEGLAAPSVGELALDTVRQAVDEVVLVSDFEILEAMEALMTRSKLYVEGAGAAATAALLSGKVRLRPGDKVVSIVSGGNLDFLRLATLASGAAP